ncbi:hypothetical protein [Neobacillus vireti]|uniref:hypothetical protein n=1 Tax=Neobacillus vireti TaxID=220686 RepID=UPI0030002998
MDGRVSMSQQMEGIKLKENEDGGNFGLGCLWGILLSIPLWILTYFIIRHVRD